MPEMPETVKGVINMSMRCGWPYRKRQGRGGGREYPLSALPPATQAALLMGKKAPILPAGGPQREDPEPRVRRYDPQDLWDYWAHRTNKLKDEAKRRLDVVWAVKKLREAGLSETAARKEIAKAGPDSYRSIIRYCTAVQGYAPKDWLPVLTPGYTGCTVRHEIDPQVWDFFKADYLRKATTGAPTAASCYERLGRAAKAQGWALPSLSTLMRRLEREIPPNLIVLLREGEDAYKAARPAQERDRTVFHAMEAVNGDGYQFSNYCLFESGEVCQPKTWYWQDLYSSKILAWRTDVSENKDMIRLSIGDLVEKYGIPKDFWLDNTRAAANKDVTGGVKNRYRFKIRDDEPLGMIPSMGATVHWTTPGHGQSKPIERAFGTGGLGEYIDKHPQFAGRGSKARPLPIAEFEAVMAAEIAAFNAREGRRGKIQRGRSYDAVFTESYAKATVTRATDKQRALWLLAPAPVTCARRDGAITILENRYWAEELAHYKGQKLVARFDPAHLHAGIFVETLAGMPICKAACLSAAGFNDRDAARAVAKDNARIRKHERKIAEAELRISAQEAAKLLPAQIEEPELPKPAAVALQFAKKPQQKVVNGIDYSEPEEDTYNFRALTLAALREKQKNRL
ncbi:transposase domain-containing protein [Geoalkalibacter halelectricus]|uniref:transposase domain-containing protein n=1 Tax=Geoalkalibacter halelectricus TaxID=2847045 RepID=UPI003D1A88FA